MRKLPCSSRPRFDALCTDEPIVRGQALLSISPPGQPIHAQRLHALMALNLLDENNLNLEIR